MARVHVCPPPHTHSYQHLHGQKFHKRWRLSLWMTFTPFRTLVWYKEHSSAWYFQQKLPDTSHTWRKRTETPCGCAEIPDFLMSCNSGTARWKNLVPVAYCRATQELQNGGWIMGISPSKPKCTTFCARHFLWALANSVHKNVHRGAHGRLWVMGLEREESRKVALSSGLCLES